MKPKIKIAIVDDEELFRKSLILLITSYNNKIEVVFDGSNGQEFIDYVTKEGSIIPDIVLMDIRMPQLNGIETTIQLNTLNPNISVIVLSSIVSSYCREFMLKNGVKGYLSKSSSPEEVLNAIQEVYKKGVSFDHEMIDFIVSQKYVSNRHLKTHHQLSEREIEIIQLICSELTNKQIAQKLNLSERTIEGHRKNMIQKTNSTTIAGLILFAVREQLIQIY